MNWFIGPKPPPALLAALRMVYNPSRKKGRSFQGEELPMSEEALRRWYWAGVIVSALALWVPWLLVRT